MLRVSAIVRRVALFLGKTPHVLALVATLFAVAELVIATTPLHDPDVWWVAAAGRELLSSGRVPATNLFSFTDPDRAWIMHEWLLGPLYAAGLLRFGPGFFVVLGLCVAALGQALLLRGTLGGTRDVRVGLLLAFVAVAFFGSRLLSARPTGVALLFPLALVAVAFGARFGLWQSLLAVLLEGLWANCHGSFPLGWVLLTLAALDAASDRGWRWAALAGALAITALNPYGLTLHRFVWDYLVGQRGIYREIHEGIYEFRNIVGAWGKTAGPVEVVGLSLMAVLVAFAAREPRYRLRAALCGVMLCGALLQVRHIELAGLLTCLLLAPVCGQLAEHWRDTESTLSTAAARRAVLGVACATGAIGFLLSAPGLAKAGWVAQGPGFWRALAALPDRANAYVPFQSAGLAIWQDFPRGVRIFYDPRNDCYAPETARDFRKLSNLALPPTSPSELARVLDRYAPDSAVVPRGHVLEQFLSEHRGFHTLYRDASWHTLAR